MLISFCHCLTMSCSCALSASSSRITQSALNLFFIRGIKPYLPPLILDGGPSHTINAKCSGKVTAEMSYQLKSPQSLMGVSQTLVLLRLYLFRARCILFDHNPICSNTICSTPLFFAMPPTSKVDKPEPHSSIGPVQVSACFIHASKYSFSAL
jgi:hypothetical protein